ncbi:MULTISPECIES: S-adenosyl-l-methionine hydroxide adenosyltransferase family protein [unclassified Bacillus (in: firmicutes)]|uniref:SAM hydrolase/SAM-dependent halogenase family protein n=1 Tax=unclassified Bacillus (in: firmicutes) TaxID=185979 RepID=UPI000BF23E7F|nr:MULTISPECIES: S-adenosyl-l-methionine hydroxide adenosyltransferase family protein [unclassified Bacillus (in: firmicutes)]PEJ56892.1 DNA-directed RNA polymerase subunit delta [Bacillus sp. AFS002410]PEL11377.1 DNA-directed RNA polymerase subunit delta [Bacillus sp. AFS017336]
MGNALVFQSDFGLLDGAVSAMYGVSCSVDDDIKIYDLTHDIPQYNIWEASYRLVQAMNYWPIGTVFVSVVDPGVGSDRRSIVARTNTNHFIITPDNGTLTHIGKVYGISQLRVIDEEINRLPNSSESYTFHGRDIFAFTGARLATGKIDFENIGPEVDPNSYIQLPIKECHSENNSITGTIDILDVRYGSIWTNIGRTDFLKLGITHGDSVEVFITHQGRKVYKQEVKYGKSFADVAIGEPILYANSLDQMAVAVNQGSFTDEYGIDTGIEWEIKIKSNG